MIGNAGARHSLSLTGYLESYGDSARTALLDNTGKSVSHRQLIQEVTVLAQELDASSLSHWALACQDSGAFIKGLLALLASGKSVFLPANSQPGTLFTISQYARSLLTDGEGSGFVGKVESLQSPSLASSDLQTEFTVQSRLKHAPGTLYFSTSGSSGDPKLVVKPLSLLEAEVSAQEALFGAALGDAVTLSCVAHQHIYGVLFRILWPLLGGRTVHTAQFEYPEQLLAEILRHRSSVVVASPAQLDRLPTELNWGEIEGRVAQVFSSGAPLSPEGSVLGKQCLGHFPCEVLGSTETGGVAWRTQEASIRNPGVTSFWTPLPGVTTVLSKNGLLTVASPWTGEDEPVVMGDRAQRLDDGRFLLQGRADTIVKIEGKRLSLADVNRRLQDLPWVAQARVIVLQGKRQQLAAVIVLTSKGQALLEDEGRLSLSRQLKARLAQHFEAVTLPRKWRFLESLPVNSQGKTPLAVLETLFEPQKQGESL